VIKLKSTNALGSEMPIPLKFAIYVTALFLCNLVHAAPELSKGPGLLFLVGSSAPFSESDKGVQISKHHEKNNKLMIYAHGGAGMTDADKRRVTLFKQWGFDTVSFDAFAMNDLDGIWVNRNLTDRAKQDLIMNVMRGAIEFSLKQSTYTDIVLYGQSNGAKVVINAVNRHDPKPQIKMILSEAPPPSGNHLPLAMKTPTYLFFGEKDNWGGLAEDDLMWTRKPSNALEPSIKDWVTEQSYKGHPVKAILYPQSGHSFHSGNLTPVARNMAGIGTITGNIGASNEDRIQYEKDVKRIVSEVIKLD
jgi:predicted esterase